MIAVYRVFIFSSNIYLVRIVRKVRLGDYSCKTKGGFHHEYLQYKWMIHLFRKYLDTFRKNIFEI